ncbi:NADH-quinone oxidoreductase subunit C [Paenibacillus athensensis]|uniref:NADH-quinone oxidoreductase subunit C n=1 Tax=Paenibacillus athensensis TaxID=1967502 RepID=UPI001E30A117|nr:NADH-quinone oxidoreductase subunit C [Paenibacillus athensensis]MCD1260888.1 NADH-quinone oxidoreductase subunit C [Paenibacillus athensensis]
MSDEQKKDGQPDDVKADVGATKPLEEAAAEVGHVTPEAQVSETPLSEKTQAAVDQAAANQAASPDAQTTSEPSDAPAAEIADGAAAQGGESAPEAAAPASSGDADEAAKARAEARAARAAARAAAQGGGESAPEAATPAASGDADEAAKARAEARAARAAARAAAQGGGESAPEAATPAASGDADEAAKARAEARAARAAARAAAQGGGESAPEAATPAASGDADEAAKARAEARAARAAARAGAKAADEDAAPKEPSPNQPLLDRLVALVKESAGEAAITEAYINERDGHLPYIVVHSDYWLQTAELLRDHEELQCTYLRNLSGVDQETHLEVAYHLLSMTHNRNYCVKVKTDREQPSIPSVTPIWDTANWNEREVYDLLGIDFPGHPDLRRIMMPDDWVGHPLRKDYEPLDPEV